MFLGKDFNKETFIENNPFHFCRLNRLLKGLDTVAPLKRSIDTQITNLLVVIILFFGFVFALGFCFCFHYFPVPLGL